jgi:iron complex transport system ATP-binding protein
MLEVRNLSFGYGPARVVRSVSFSVERGESVSLLGANGSGKTTLLKLLLGLLQPQGGQVRWGQKPVAQIPARDFARQVAYVPQTHKATFAYTVLDVVLTGRMPYHTFFSHYGGADREVALAKLEKLGIISLWNRPYTQVSGGERQLVLIARALAQGADTFIMDEPATALDYGHQIRLLEQIMQLSREGYTFIKSTHFPDHALWGTDRVLMLQNGEVVADGRADEAINPEAFRKLFGVAVRVEIVNGLRVCVPAKLSGAKYHPVSDEYTTPLATR